MLTNAFSLLSYKFKTNLWTTKLTPGRGNKQHIHTHLEFHWADPVEDFSHVLPDHGPSDLVVALGCGLHRVPCHVVERDHVGENAHCLIEGAEPEEISCTVDSISNFKPF